MVGVIFDPIAAPVRVRATVPLFRDSGGGVQAWEYSGHGSPVGRGARAYPQKGRSMPSVKSA